LALQPSRQRRGRDGAVGAFSTMGGARLLADACRRRRRRRRLLFLFLIVADDGLQPQHLRQRRVHQWHLCVPRGLAGYTLPILRWEGQVSDR